jgi:hypothetical protein
MRLKTLYVRFYRSFNYHYLRKSDPDAKPDPWDTAGPADLFYPFVKVPLEAGITTVVGANESGKSQLLSAVKCLLDGENIERLDFCRYSDFFAVDRSMALPEFGGEFDDLSPAIAAQVRKVLGLPAEAPLRSFWYFRFDGRVELYAVDESGSWISKTLTKQQAEKVPLPTYFEINAHVPLPDSVPIDYLADGKVPALAPRKEGARVGRRDAAEPHTVQKGTGSAPRRRQDTAGTAPPPAEAAREGRSRAQGTDGARREAPHRRRRTRPLRVR